VRNSSMNSSAASISAEVAGVTLSDWLRVQCGSEGMLWQELIYCSWPESFANTSGPFFGIGGQSITTFRMEAWCWEQWAVIFCNGRFVKCGEFQIQAEWEGRGK
jgi:hypothetical protein